MAQSKEADEDPAHVEKLMGGNYLRVYSEVWGG